MEKRVVITGIGAITPLGNTAEEFWQNLRNGELGIGTITRFNTDNFKVKIAAEVKNFDAEKYMQKKETKRMDLFCQYALAAAIEAVADSKLETAGLDKQRFGVMVGSGIGGLDTIEEQVIRLHDKGPGRVGPLFIPMAISNMAAGNIAIRFGAEGVCSAIVTACASGTNCIGEAYRSIKHGYNDIIIAGGSEASVTEIGIAGFSALTALTECEDITRASIPFDKERDGFVMGEGAGILILEELEHALKRDAFIYGEVTGYGTTCDAYHMTSPSPDGTGAAGAISAAMTEAGITAEQAGKIYINAHGTSTQHNDKAETNAIKTVFREHTSGLLISSTKSMTGHLLGAAGALEAIACIGAIRDSFVPPTLGYKVADPDCDLNYVPNKGVSHEVEYALNNSFGFGGHNAVICIKKWSGE